MSSATRQPSWQVAMSFSDRLAAITEIAQNLQLAEPESNTAAARKRATEIEKEILSRASSREHYDGLCHEWKASLQPHSMAEAGDSNEEEEEDDDGYPPPPTAVALGLYSHAQHFRDGLFSHVFKAPALPNRSGFVALKVTTPSMMEKPHDSEKEARILSGLSSSNVIELVETFQMAGGRFVLVFPFMIYDLDTLLQKERLDQSQVLSHLRDMFRALEFLHDRRIIHRDVKPSNLLLKTPSGPAYLSDFGIAWSPDDEASEVEDNKITDVGTTCYRPPELLFGNRGYGDSLDLWAAGCVVAEATSLGHKTLFNAGDLGSELALIKSMFQNLGTPTNETWPEAETFDDWGKMEFHKYPGRPWSELMPQAPKAAQDLAAKLVVYESGCRLRASEALRHPYLL